MSYQFRESTESVADKSIGVVISTQFLLFGNSVLRTKLAHANILQTKQAKTGLIRDHIRTDNQVSTIANNPRKSRLFKNFIRQR